MTMTSRFSIEATDDGLELIARTPKQWWQFWRAGTITVSLGDRKDAITFYQWLGKLIRPMMIRADVSDAAEFADDVTRAILAADNRFPRQERLAPDMRGDAWYKFVADVLRQKGYAKT